MKSLIYNYREICCFRGAWSANKVSLNKNLLLFYFMTFITLSSVTSFAANKSSKKSTRQGLSEGYTTSELLLMGQNRWAYALDQSFSRGLDEFADSYYSTTSANISYRYTSWSAISASLGYQSLFLAWDGKPFDNYNSRPERFGLTDVSLGFSIPGFWKNSRSSLSYFSFLSLPTSSVSRRATKIFSLSNKLVYRYRPFRRGVFYASTFLSLGHYGMDDADVFGYEVNSPLRFGFSLGSSFSFLKWLILSTKYSFHQRVDYNNNWQSIQAIVASLNFNINSNVGVYMGYSYRDRIITNDELFDDDRSLIFSGVSYAF